MAISELDYYKIKGLLRNNKKSFMIIVSAVITSAIVISYLAPKEYEARSTIYIEKNMMSDIIKGIAVSPSIDDTVKDLTYKLTSRALVRKVINQVDFNFKMSSDTALEYLIDEVQRKTDVKIHNDSFVQIKFRYPNPHIARDYVNALVRNFIEENISLKRDASYEALSFLSGQIDIFKQRLEEAENAADQFKQDKSGVVNLEPGWLLQQINMSQQQMIENKSKLKFLEEQKMILEREYNPLRKELEFLKKQLVGLRLQFTDDYPEIQSLKLKIESLKAEIATRSVSNQAVAESIEIKKIDSEINALKDGQAELEAYILKNQQFLANIPPIKSNLQQLETRKLNEQNIYDLLSMRRNQSELSKEMELQDKTTNLKIVDPATTPTYPVSPNRKKIIILGIFAGIGLAMAVLISKDALNDSVTMVATLKTLNIPVLAVIPLIQSETEIQIDKRKDLILYVFGAIYLAGISLVFIFEFIGNTYIDTMINRLYFSAAVTKFLGKLMY